MPVRIHHSAFFFFLGGGGGGGGGGEGGTNWRITCSAFAYVVVVHHENIPI